MKEFYFQMKQYKLFWILIISPIFAFLNLIFSLNPLFKDLSLLISLCVFVFYFGYLGFKLIISIISRKSGRELAQNLSIFEIFVFSILIGISINLIFGLLALFTNIYSSIFNYIIFFEIFAIIYYYFFKKNPDVKIHFSIKKVLNKQDIIILIALLFPAFWRIIETYSNQPYPFLFAWDLFVYQGRARLIFLGESQYYYAFGFSTLCANLVLISNIPFIQIIEFDKLGFILTLGPCIIILYLILFKITKSKLISLCCGILTSSYNGEGALGPNYFHPSTFAWVFGLAAIYLSVMYYSENSPIKASSNANQSILNWKSFLILISMLSGFSLLLHLYTGIMFSINSVFFILLHTKFFKKNRFLVYIFLICEALFIFIGGIFFQSLLNQIFNPIFQTSAQNSDFFGLFFVMWQNGVLFLALFGICYSLILLYKNKNEHSLIAQNFIFVFLFYLLPISFVFRIQYFIVIYATLLLGIFLRSIKEFQVNSQEKLDFPRFSAYMKRRIKHIEGAFLILGYLFLIFIYPIPGVHTMYSPEEFEGASYIYNNIDVRSHLVITEPATGVIFCGLSGIRFVDASNKAMYRNCGPTGLNKTDLYNDIQFGLNKSISGLYGNIQQTDMHYILILSARMHQWIQTEKSIASELVNSTWVNQTLVEYVSYTPGIVLLFNNSMVAIYSISFSQILTSSVEVFVRTNEDYTLNPPNFSLNSKKLSPLESRSDVIGSFVGQLIFKSGSFHRIMPALSGS